MTAFYDRNMLILKINNEGMVEWAVPIKRHCRSHAASNLSGQLNYITEDGDIEIIFNSYQNDFKKDTYAPKRTKNLNIMKITKGTIPTKATINLYTGDLKIKPILQDEGVKSITFVNAQEIDEAGKYKLILYKGKDSFISVVDFK